MQKTRKATAQSAKMNKQSNRNDDEDFNQDESDLSVRAKRMNIAQVTERCPKPLILSLTPNICIPFNRSKKQFNVIKLKLYVLKNLLNLIKN